MYFANQKTKENIYDTKSCCDVHLFRCSSSRLNYWSKNCSIAAHISHFRNSSPNCLGKLHSKQLTSESTTHRCSNRNGFSHHCLSYRREWLYVRHYSMVYKIIVLLGWFECITNTRFFTSVKEFSTRSTFLLPTLIPRNATNSDKKYLEVFSPNVNAIVRAFFCFFFVFLFVGNNFFALTLLPPKVCTKGSDKVKLDLLNPCLLSLKILLSLNNVKITFHYNKRNP